MHDQLSLQLTTVDCSSTNRERELGLDRRETGQFYPTITNLSQLWYADLVREEP